MNTKLITASAFAAVSIAFLAYLVLSAPALPNRMATHFDMHGQPNGWMPRLAYLLVFGSVSLSAAMSMVALCFAVRFFPEWTINIPHREYWLAPERRAQTFDFVARWGLWLGCLFLSFLGAVHYLVVEANSHMPVPRLSGIVDITVLFVMGLIALIVFLLGHFGKTRTAD